ncbi:hypothetical protein [Seonamhaeicola sp.]|uniref:hypothetical protein n=1 Tax=Seonamhaeicola sp. TaxID=1912245 RepID=UPI00356458E4
MYKALYKIILLLILPIIITFCSCESRQSKNDLLQESISKYKNDFKLIEVKNYYPKTYNEIITDTILSNGYTVKIKTFTDMNNAVSVVSKTSTIYQTDYYRQVTSEVVVFKNNKLIFNKSFNSNFLKQHVFENKNSNNFINNYVYVDEAASLNSNKLVLIASQISPKSNTKDIYKIEIDETGLFTLNKLNYART